jgi:hypothetical protein
MENEPFGEYVANDGPHGGLRGAGDPAGGIFSNASEGITEFLFKKDTLDRQLMRKHLAGKFLRVY